MKFLKDPRLRAYLGLAVLAAGLVGLALSGDLLVHSLRFASFYVLSGAGFALLATAATSLPLRGAIVAAVILRLVFLPVMPSLTTDYHRYVWDGRVQLAGVNPYRYRPYEHPLDGVHYAGRAPHQPRRAEDRLPAAHRGGLPRRRRRDPRRRAGARGDAARRSDPLQAGLRRVRPGHGGGRVVPRRAQALRVRATVLYLLCPAVILQTWGSAHAEAAAVFFCVLAAALLVRRRDGWAGVALGLAAALKVTPLGLLVPALLGGRASPARFLAGFIPAFVIPYVPYLLTGGAFGSLFESGTSWTGGSLVVHAARAVHDPPDRPLARAGPLRRRRPVDRRQLPRPGGHRGGLRLDLHAAHPVPARGPRLVLAHAAGAGTRRRPLAAAGAGDVLAPPRVAAAGGLAGARPAAGDWPAAA